jgi:hypothetical protein
MRHLLAPIQQWFRSEQRMWVERLPMQLVPQVALALRLQLLLSEPIHKLDLLYL